MANDKRLKQAFWLSVLFFLFLGNMAGLRAQGCSDAGFCTMGAMRPDQKYHKKGNIKLRSLEASHYYGLTRFKDHIFSYTIDVNLGINEKTSFQIKLPYMMVSGPLGNTNGVGDFSLSLTRNLYFSENWQVNATVGGKVPTGTPDKSNDGRPLPMYYQSTLGTYDLVAGISAQNKHWLVALGYQQPLNRVENQFLWTPWAGFRDAAFFETVVKHYPVSNGLNRGNDLMFRLERNFRFSRLNFSLGTLHIYRVKSDYVVRNGERQIVPQTTGMAWTVLLGAGYRLSPKSAIKTMLGRKIVNRYVNPDGLSREWVHTIGYELRF